MSRIAYLLREALVNMGRNALVVVGAILAVFVSLTLAFSALVLNELVKANTLQWQDGVHVIVWLKDEVRDGVTFEAQMGLLDEVNGWEEVDTASFVGKAEAYQEFQEMFASNPAMLENVNPAILPASIRIKLNNIEEYRGVQLRLIDQPVVKEVTSPGESIEQLADLSNVLNMIGVVLAIVQGASAVVLISNTIRMAIYARREEIGIMKLVGASNWFIRVPFVLEGMLQGFVGALFAVVMVFFARTRLEGIDDTIGLFDFQVADSFFWRWTILFLLFGALAGFLGSALGVRRYLKE
ncbi:MAG TPA: permease-like cell division protein FtsX [Acidimicrobiia bacterium]|nr:permease-like cell division protein FtsX [Acidimicrobiia bacterium]